MLPPVELASPSPSMASSPVPLSPPPSSSLPGSLPSLPIASSLPFPEPFSVAQPSPPVVPSSISSIPISVVASPSPAGSSMTSTLPSPNSSVPSILGLPPLAPPSPSRHPPCNSSNPSSHPSNSSNSHPPSNIPSTDSIQTQTPHFGPIVPPPSNSWSARLRFSIRTLSKKASSKGPNPHQMHIPSEVMAEGCNIIHRCVLGQFYGRSPSITRISVLANSLWGKLSPVKTQKLENGNLLFIFNSKQSRDIVLSKPIWYLGNLPIFLSEWRPGLSPDKPSLAHLPIWVIFRGLPLELFTKTGLSYVASTIGQPLYLDKATESLSRVDFAKVCIEVSILEELPDNIIFSFDDSPDLKIQVEYPWRPPICDDFGAIGHPKSLCPSPSIPSQPSRSIQPVQATLDISVQASSPLDIPPVPSQSLMLAPLSVQSIPSNSISAPSSLPVNPSPIPSSESSLLPSLLSTRLLLLIQSS